MQTRRASVEIPAVGLPCPVRRGDWSFPTFGVSLTPVRMSKADGAWGGAGNRSVKHALVMLAIVVQAACDNSGILRLDSKTDADDGSRGPETGGRVEASIADAGTAKTDGGGISPDSVADGSGSAVDARTDNVVFMDTADCLGNFDGVHEYYIVGSRIYRRARPIGYRVG